MDNQKVGNWFFRMFLESWRPYFWIALAILAVYVPTLFYGIVYLDDNVLVIRDYAFNQNLGNIFQAFCEDIFRSPAGAGSFYRPIERLTFMWDAQFGQGAIVFMSHFSNLLLHIFAICLLYKLLLKFGLGRPFSFILSLIFAVHPLTAQTVSFISGRNDSLLAIFIFPSLLFFLEYLKNPRRRYYFGHLAFFLLALFTKETAVILPVICVAYLVIFKGLRDLFVNVRRYGILLAGWTSGLLFWFIMRHLVLGNFIGNANYHIGLSIFQNLPALVPALGKVILPFNLSVFPILQDMTSLYGFLSLVILAGWFVSAKKKNYRWIIFGAAWFFLFIVLTLIKPAGTVADFSENRIYLPMFGFIFIFWGLGSLKFLDFEKHKKKYLALGAILILIFSSVTIYRNRYYKDQLSFWKNAVATAPDYAFNYNNLGAMYFMAGNMDMAETNFKKALTLNPKEPMVHNNLGLIDASRHQDVAAKDEYQAEIAVNPSYDAVYFNLGLLYYNQGKLDVAAENWRKTLNINSGYADALYDLAQLDLNKKNYAEAAACASRLAASGAPLPPDLSALLDPLTLIQLESGSR
ncbi:MAG: glycosyltransferase family 39 protein [Candidatus Pacebacteria bacterium]|nr:glycosyltransferase family 39 protein [Candidatus Paceibacterota bacterium]